MIIDLTELRLIATEKKNDDLLWMADYLNHAGGRYRAGDWGSSNGHIVCMRDEESY